MSLSLTVASQCEAVWFKLLLYGNSGAGKTWRAVQARKPGDPRKVLALLTEANGVQSARHANPSVLLPSWPLTRRAKNAAGVLVDEPMLDAAGKPMVRHYATQMSEVREVFAAVQNREVEGLDVLVIDGLTEVQAMMKDEMQRMKDRAVAEGKAKREALVFSMVDWGELGEKMRRLMRNLRDLPVHVVSTALAEVDTDEDGDKKTRYTVPSFQGKKLANQAASYNNVVAYCYTSRGRGEGGAQKIDRLAMVEGPETIQCKPAYPLGGVIDIPLWDWLDLLAKPPEDGMKVGRAPTTEEQAALDAATAEGAKQTAERKARAEKPVVEEEIDPDVPRVDLSAGQEPPKEQSAKPASGTNSPAGSVNRVRRTRGSP